MSTPEVALLMSTFERPGHLRRALQSIAQQQGVAGKIELVVTDDGSRDESAQVVSDFARTVDFPVKMTTHPHTTFRLARCRNEGVEASEAPYLLFLDGDCVLPSDHVRIHLARRKAGVVMAGDCCRLDQKASERASADVIRSGEFQQWSPPSEIRRLRKLDRSSRFYQLIRHPSKPKLIGNNVGIWRQDYERVNGYDENFEGWGCEDDDLRYRLRSANVRIESILRWTRTYHLWHPTDITAPDSWKKGANVRYLLRPGRLTRCRNGLTKRGLDDIAMRIVGPVEAADTSIRLPAEKAHAHGAHNHTAQPHTAPPEVEIIVLPGSGRFSGKADCDVLIARGQGSLRGPLLRQAHLTIVSDDAPAWRGLPQAALDQIDQALGRVA